MKRQLTERPAGNSIFAKSIRWVILFFALPIIAHSQISETIRLKADSILLDVTKQEKLDGVFQYNCSKSSTIINNTYWHECDELTKRQKRIFRKEDRKSKDKKYEIVYNCLLLDTIPELVKIYLDENGSLIRITGVSYNGFICLKMLQITKDSAEEIAARNEFQRGLTSWETYMVFDHQKEKYFWIIKNTMVLEDEFGCNGSGELLYIDALKGVVVEKRYWENACI